MSLAARPMRLTTRTNIAARALMFCAIHADRQVRSLDIAGNCNTSLHHMLQVIGLLQVHGFVTTTRGRNGGLRLARSPGQISIGQVFRIFEADVPFAECFAGKANTCPLTENCRLRGYLIRALEAFYHEMDMVTLEDLVKGNCGLAELLSLSPAHQMARPGCTNTANLTALHAND